MSSGTTTVSVCELGVLLFSKILLIPSFTDCIILPIAEVVSCNGVGCVPVTVGTMSVAVELVVLSYVDVAVEEARMRISIVDVDTVEELVMASSDDELTTPLSSVSSSRRSSPFVRASDTIIFVGFVA